MKNRFKFMIGNEFLRTIIPSTSTVIYNGGDIDESKNKLQLTGITTDCLIKMAKSNGHYLFFGDEMIAVRAILNIEEIDFYKDEAESEKQFCLRVAKEMGWVEMESMEENKKELL